jgi:hypothetical protein
MSGGWWDENWASWLRPVLLLLLAGGIFFLYSNGVLSDFVTGLVVILIATVGILLVVVRVEAPRLPESRRGGLYGLAAVFVLSVVAPMVPVLWPGEPLVQGKLQNKGDTLSLSGLPGEGSYLVIAGGSVAPSVTGDVEVEYTLQGKDADGSFSQMEGAVRQSSHATGGRRGVSGRAISVHSQEKSVLALSPKEPLLLTNDVRRETVPGGLNVAIYARPVLGLWIFLLSGLLLVVILVYEAKYAPEKGKGYLAAGVGLVLVAGLYFAARATPYAPFTQHGDLASHAAGGALLGFLAGGLGGALLSWGVGRFVERPALERNDANEASGA